MKKLVYFLAFILLIAGLTSCAGSRQVAHAQVASTHLYGSNLLLNSYAGVHQRAPID